MPAPAAAVGPEAEEEHGEDEREFDDGDDNVKVGERFCVGGDGGDGEGGADGGQRPVDEERGRADGGIGIIEVVGSADASLWSHRSLMSSLFILASIRFYGFYDSIRCFDC